MCRAPAHAHSRNPRSYAPNSTSALLSDRGMRSLKVPYDQWIPKYSSACFVKVFAWTYTVPTPTPASSAFSVWTHRGQSRASPPSYTQPRSVDGMSAQSGETQMSSTPPSGTYGVASAAEGTRSGMARGHVLTRSQLHTEPPQANLEVASSSHMERHSEGGAIKGKDYPAVSLAQMKTLPPTVHTQFRTPPTPTGHRTSS
ncbi:hypothetical protein B0H12DRAFT_1072474 [Mycena haematopus]|nr:hypothetical protein B0H12DRAFT_1072474 [Mycena haematopus]